jgi:hypothetical protein
MSKPILNEEFQRMQKLAGIITEVEQQSSNDEAKVEKNVEAGLEKLLKTIDSAKQNVKPSPKDGELNELILTLGSLVAGAPGLLNLLGKAVTGVVDFFSLDNVDHTALGDALQKAGHKLEHKYVDSIAGWLQFAFPKKFKGQDPHDEKSDLYDKAHGIYAAMLTGAAIASGVEAVNAASVILKGLEGGLSAFKTAEVIGLAKNIAKY